MQEVHDSLEFSISQATLEDLDELQGVEDRVFSVPWSRKSFEAELSGNEFSQILVARGRNAMVRGHRAQPTLSQRMIGYICVWIVFEELRFMNIAVEADMRRRGIGSELLKNAMKIGVKQGVQRALLEVRESNHAAQALYMHFGFEAYGKRDKYYTNPDEDAMLMALEPVVIPMTKN